jgi:hypothetical protein
LLIISFLGKLWQSDWLPKLIFIAKEQHLRKQGKALQEIITLGGKERSSKARKNKLSS